MSDQVSKDVLEAYLNQRISGKFGYLARLWRRNQYFDSDIVDVSKIQNIVDCGAYNGDTYRSFLEIFKSRTHKDFEGKAWLFEAEPQNIILLTEKHSNDRRVVIVDKGVGKEHCFLSFSGGAKGGKIGSGEARIEVDSIDNVVTGRVDFIKMDIEGSECDALLGAKNTIQQYRPLLAICVYHKRDDLFTIPKIIHDMCNDYKFYLRAHSRHSIEIVLYAKIEP